MEISDQRFRQFARTGARDAAVRIVTEFPDILPELNALTKTFTNRRLVDAAVGMTPAPNGTRRMSAATRKKMQAGQRKRWATWRKANGRP
jgi:hypothetical protein